MPANPYMKPAWIQTQDQVRLLIKEKLADSTLRAMRKIIKKGKKL